MKKENKNNNKIRYILFFLFMFALFIIITILNINIGSVHISVSKIFKIIFFRQGEKGYYNIIWHIRLPRICMAAILGGALSLSGLLLQIFFNNPIAGPYILGISSGAKMVVALTLVYLLEKIGRVSSITLIIAAFAGSMLSIAFILLLSKYIRSMSVLIIGGIMINYICSAVTDFVITFASDSDIINLHGWSLGSFSASNWRDVGIAFVVVTITSVTIFFLAKPISAFLLGEAYAKSVGVNIKVFRVVLILLSSILSACVTAFAGPISFVGIAVPHLIKRGLKTSKPIIVIPACFIGGSIFCMVCDLIARTAFSPTELNISTVTAIFGAPIVIVMLIKSSKGR
ncbi:MAG: iron ABC transporter permease [Lachnospiraceae bacterium]|nr:iron ABC transporter permease [Lachnospiraceae bacterium]